MIQYIWEGGSGGCISNKIPGEAGAAAPWITLLDSRGPNTRQHCCKGIWFGSWNSHLVPYEAIGFR